MDRDHIDHAKQCVFEGGVEGYVVDVLHPRKPTNPLRGRSLVKQRRYIPIALFTASVWPSVCEWKEELTRSLDHIVAKRAFRT